MSRPISELYLTALAQQFVDSYDDLVDTWLVLFSILFDPEIDQRNKFALNSFPYISARVLVDDSWYIVYHVEGNDVVVSSIMLQADLPDPHQFVLN